MRKENSDLWAGGRNNKRREEAHRYKVITNGIRTEFGYFIRVNELAFDNIEVEARKGFSLDGMLDLAKNIRQRSGGNYDEICIVLDIDTQMNGNRERKKLKKFLEDAREAEVPVYLSNESFEIWLLAHKMVVPKIAAKRKKATTLALENGLLGDERHKEIVENEINGKSIAHALSEVARLRREYGEDILISKPMTDVDLLIKNIRLK